jgi:hypothetical protein
MNAEETTPVETEANRIIQAQHAARAAETAAASNERDLYNKLTKWYDKHPSCHRPFIVLVLIMAVAGAWVSKRSVIGMHTGSVFEGYDTYTPIYWLIGFITWLLAAFAFRYSSFSEGGFKSWQKRLASMSPGLQGFVIAVTLVALIYEASGLAHGFTLSSELRDSTLFSPISYWIAGVLTGMLAGSLVDVQVPHLIRLMSVVWVATLAHVFWWITPPTVEHSIKSSGITRIHKQITSEHMPGFISGATRKIRVFVPWFTEPLVLKPLLEEKAAQEQMSIEIFLMDPASPFLEQRGKVIQPDNENFGAEEVTKAYLALKQAFAKADPKRVHIYALKSLPSALMVQADNKAYVGFYMHKGVATLHPIIEVERGNGEDVSWLAGMIEAEFEQLKRYSDHVDIPTISTNAKGIAVYRVISN